MGVDILPDSMRFVSVDADGRFDLEFVFEITSGLARFTLPVCVGGQASIDEALVEATDRVRLLGLAMAKAAGDAGWVECQHGPTVRPEAARRQPPPHLVGAPMPAIENQLPA
jgi:hypothetical protein